MVTTYRQGCGTHMGLLLHHAADEPPCGECARGELLRRVSVEEWPIRPARPLLAPVTPEQAEENLRLLLDEVAEFEAGKRSAA
ncbi:hypothetical protein [Nonomuraea sp. NPDC001023]|uniref:hypothetical protein n=1 Tax=unclassified Nonomuraea TaxID=2593643 RepID=UPI003317DEFE